MEAQPGQPTTTTDSEDIVFKIFGWLHANRKPVIAAGTVVAVGAIGFGLYNWKQGQNDLDANAKLLSLPVGNNFVVGGSSDTLSQIATDYSSTPAGEYAALLAAENSFVKGDYSQARQAFFKFQTDHPGSSLSAQAGVGIAASFEGEGKIPDAIQQYQKVITANSTDGSIVEPAKLTLGRLEEEQNHFDLAFSQYRDLAQMSDPNSLWAEEAKERLQLLVANHPDLIKQMMPATSAQSPSATSTAAPTLSAGPAATLSASPAAGHATDSAARAPILAGRHRAARRHECQRPLRLPPAWSFARASSSLRNDRPARISAVFGNFRAANARRKNHIQNASSANCARNWALRFKSARS